MGTRPASLLVVDDNDLNREMLARRFQRKGYAVTTAINGSQALELIAGQRFDLLLLDILMPGISGIELLKRVRQVHSPTELPIIMVTAVDESSQVVEALNLGANDYVTKPVDFPVVFARIRTQLTLKQSVDRVVLLERNLQQQNEELAQTNEYLEAVNAELAQAYQRVKTDLHLAAQVQKSLLPKEFPPLDKGRFAWHTRSCSELAGDLLNVVRLDEDRVGVYVLDVAGHGVAAALLAVMVTRVLGRLVPPYTARPDRGTSRPHVRTPAEVARELAAEFPGNPQTEQYFTIVYGILDLKAFTFRFISAGHPRPLCVSRSGTMRVLDADGLPIGWGQNDYREALVPLQPGDRLLLYSDGLTESVDADRELFGENRVKETLLRGCRRPLTETLQDLAHSVESWCGQAGPRDDISILLCEVGEPFAAEATSVAVTSGPTDTNVRAAPVAEVEPWQRHDTQLGVATEQIESVATGPTSTLEAFDVGGSRTLLPPTTPTRADLPGHRDRPSSAPWPTPGERLDTPRPSKAEDQATQSLLSPPRGPDELGWLGHYRVLKVLGIGGMATVFVAEDSSLQRRVALKVMKPELAEDETFRQRFVREARATAAIDHDHIVTIYQVAEERHVPFFAMQLLQGESLQGRLHRDVRLPIADLLRIGRETAEGLEAAHERSLIHRDIKPDNIWLELRSSASGAVPRVKLLDFGLVRPAGHSTGLTRAGLVMGTPAYMSPEQARGLVLDPRSDIFSLGTVIYEMATGRLPFGGGDTMAVLTALAVDNPLPLEEWNRDVPPALTQLVLRMLAKKREDRPTTAGDVIQSIRAIEGALVGAAR